MDLEKALELAIADLPEDQFKDSGIVIKFVDNIASVYGLENAFFGEVVRFIGGQRGVILSMDEHFVSVAVFEPGPGSITQGQSVQRTGDVTKIGVGPTMLGRVLDSLGQPVDSNGPIEVLDQYPIERTARGIIDRAPVNQPLYTGVTAIDTLIPIGKGQRELIVGDRSTGKTALLLDTIVNQRDKNVICIYVTIGNKQSSTARMVNTLANFGALSYTIIVQADAFSSPLAQFFAPYTGCAIAEYFMDQGRDVLVIYDDLLNHAVAYRELSLLLKRPSGREAYPGDIFYIHSRLLERACKLKPELGGGSITALPVVQTQNDDISSYITTNIISITDGQIILNSGLFNSGVRPAIDIGASVSRVGGSAQNDAIRKVAGALKLDLTQYRELESFAQFGSELDKKSLEIVERGTRAVEILKQSQFALYTFVDQLLFIFLLKEGFLDQVSVDRVKDYATGFSSYVRHVVSDLYQKIYSSGDFLPPDAARLADVAHEFALIYSKDK